MSSKIVGFENMSVKANAKYLISIGIGPVQDFIVSARRSRDLWFGSWLLSELSKAAANSIREQGGVLIFPRIENSECLKKNSEFNVVNKILAEIEANPKDVGDKVETAIHLRLDEIRDKAFRNLPNQFFEVKKANLQVSDLIEFFWAAVELNGDYKKSRDKVEKLFSARKSTRDFANVTWGAAIPKSSLDGQRESCINENAYGKLSKEKLRVQFGVKEGERLCGVGLLKRNGNREGDDSFFSTSHVASLPLLERLKNQNQTKATEDYKKEISRLLKETGEIGDKDLHKIIGMVPENLRHEVFGEFDGHLLFAERLSEFFSDEKKLKSAKAKLRKFLDHVIGKNKEPLPYYALLLADGDFMGKAIEKQETKERLQDLSANLSEFASDVKRTIENEKQGSLIYAGGDDVLAFVGLHKALDYAGRLAKDFKDKLTEFKYEAEKSPTLSVGIAVVHHLEPLEDALELVRKAEKTAKNVTGKNALAVVVDKRSGTSRIAKGMWGTLDERLKTFIAWHRAGAIPSGAAYELRDLAYRLEIPENAINTLKANLIGAKEKEAQRILKRKRKDRGENAIDEKTITKLNDYIKQIGETKEENEDGIAILADELIIAKIFAEAEDLAEGSQINE